MPEAVWNEHVHGWQFAAPHSPSFHVIFFLCVFISKYCWVMGVTSFDQFGE